MLFKAMKQDRARPAILVALRDEWLRTGASAPLLVDLLETLPNRGEHAFRRIRMAIGRCQAAQDVMRAYVTEAGDRFNFEVERLTWGLTADQRPAGVVLAELQAAQGAPSAERQTAIDTLNDAVRADWYHPVSVLPKLQADMVHGAIGIRQMILDRMKRVSPGERLVLAGQIVHAPRISETLVGVYGQDKVATYKEALNRELVRIRAAARLNHRVPTLRWFNMSPEKAQAMVEFVLAPLDPQWLADPLWARHTLLLSDW